MIDLTPAAEYKGLKAGDEITVQWTQDATMAATVTGTCAFGALVQCHSEPHPFEMYVRDQNNLGNWYR